MKKTAHRLTIISLALAITVVLAGTAVYFFRHDLSRTVERASLPAAVEYSPQPSLAQQNPRALVSPAPLSSKAPVINAPAPNLPAEVNLAVPFTPQAPDANWDPPYKEFCEEASVLMAYRYVQSQPISSPADASAAMLDMWAFEQSAGYSEDTNIAQTATILTEHLDYQNIQVIENPTAHDIRAALAAGKPVIVPAAGRLLGNPYYAPPGPPYHMLVVKGYTKDGRFITNDPGTRRGADFVYDEATLMNALHDWPGHQDILQGKKVILIVG